MGTKSNPFDTKMRLGDIPDVVHPLDYGSDGDEHQATPLPPTPSTNPGKRSAQRTIEERVQLDARAKDRAGGVSRADLVWLAVALAAWDVVIHVVFSR
jgi:hypothetical protein